MQPFPFEEFDGLAQRSSKIKIFHEEFLTKFVKHSGAVAGVAWDCTQRPFRSICQINSMDSKKLKMPLSEEQHQALLSETFDKKNPILVMPEKPDDTSLSALIVSPIRRNENFELVEFVLPNRKNCDHRKTLDQLRSCCELAGRIVQQEGFYETSNGTAGSLKSSQAAKDVSPEQVSRFVRAIHSSLDYQATAANIANEGRILVGCDRVSVALRKGNRFEIQAISGQPSVNRKSNNVFLLRELINRVLRTGQTLWYPSDNELTGVIETALNDYLSVSATRSILIEPVLEKLPAADAEPIGDSANEKVVGAIIVESFARQWERQDVETTIDILNCHGGDAIRNAITHKSLFLYSIWRVLGKSRVIAVARNLSKSLVAGLLLVTGILAMVLIPWDFNVGCQGIIVPRERQRIYAEINGKVSQLNIQHASEVKKDQTIIHLTSDELEMEYQELVGRRELLQQELESAQSMRLSDLNGTQQRSMKENSETLEAMVRSVERQLEILSAKRQKLEIKSPLAGEVITWDFAERLADRPIKDGDFLVEVADIDGPWEIELALPDRKIGYVRTAAKRHNGPLKVTFILAANPGVKYTGRIKYIAESTQLQPDRGQSIKVVVEFDSDAIELKHARSEVQAKVHCGKKSIGYVWLHPVGEFIQTQIFFRLW